MKGKQNGQFERVKIWQMPFSDSLHYPGVQKASDHGVTSRNHMGAEPSIQVH